MVEEAARMAHEGKGANARKAAGVAVVWTKPPESIMSYFKYWDSGGKERCNLLVFDSHSRPYHDGCAIMKFENTDKMARYLRRLFFVDPSVSDIFMYNIFDALFLVNKEQAGMFEGKFGSA